MEKIKALDIALYIIVANILIGIFLPMGILITPIVFMIVTGVVGASNEKLTSISKILILVGLFSLNDIAVKASIGNMDYQGLGWINMLFVSGSGLSFMISIFGIWGNEKESVKDKIIATLLFPSLIGLHLLTFDTLGVSS